MMSWTLSFAIILAFFSPGASIASAAGLEEQGLLETFPKYQRLASEIKSVEISHFIDTTHSYRQEFIWAQEQFLGIIEKHPEDFPEVTLSDLRKLKPQIFMTAQPLFLCGSSYQIQAYSDYDLNWTTVNMLEWSKKRTWAQKVLLAAHELLVLARVEPSNRYNISRRVLDFSTSSPKVVFEKPPWLENMSIDTRNTLKSVVSRVAQWTMRPPESPRAKEFVDLYTSWKASLIKVVGIESAWQPEEFARPSQDLWQSIFEYYSPLLKQAYESKGYWYLEPECVNQLGFSEGQGVKGVQP